MDVRSDGHRGQAAGLPFADQFDASQFQHQVVGQSAGQCILERNLGQPEICPCQLRCGGEVDLASHGNGTLERPRGGGLRELETQTRAVVLQLLRQALAFCLELQLQPLRLPSVGPPGDHAGANDSDPHCCGNPLDVCRNAGHELVQRLPVD